MCSITANLYREIRTKGVVFGTYSKSTWVAMSRENELEKSWDDIPGWVNTRREVVTHYALRRTKIKTSICAYAKEKKCVWWEDDWENVFEMTKKNIFFSNCIALLSGNADNWNQSSSVHNSQTKGENNNNALGMAHQHASIFYIPRSSRRSQSHCSATGTGYCWGMLR